MYKVTRKGDDRMLNILTCSTCGTPIVSDSRAFLVADDVTEDGKVVALRNWRVVHQGNCDPHDGPWHDLLPNQGKGYRVRLLNRMRREGAFKTNGPEELQALASALLISFDGKQFHS